jgi:hypothetical protein
MSSAFGNSNPKPANLAESSVNEPKGQVMNDISMYENSYNSRVIYSRKLYFVLLL